MGLVTGILPIVGDTGNSTLAIKQLFLDKI